MNRFKFAGSIYLLYIMTLAITVAPGSVVAEVVFIKATAKGDFYFKMSAKSEAQRPGAGEVGSSDGMNGTAYRVRSGDRDEVLWRTSGWFSDNVFLSPTGTRLVRVEEDMMYLYQNGRQVASRSAGSTSLGDRFRVDTRRSGFSMDEKDFHLVTSSGRSEIFSLRPKAAGASNSSGLRTLAKRVESTVSYDRTVRNYAEVQVNVQGQSRRSGSTVANSVSSKQSASTLIGVKITGDTGSERAVSREPDPILAKSINPVDVAGMYECRVEVKLYASATRKKVTSTRQIHQSGASEDTAADRAMAYCEGIVGAGSKTPRGRCEPRECTNLNSGAVPRTD